ncbi:MAG: STAS domain-containing protein [Ruminococcus sp.]|jgi:anti-sigma B factor antagonist|nr:STAS domain-containing protein [Ruminococcus sp.]
METTKNAVANGIEIVVSGRIDTVTAPDLQTALLPEFADVKEITLNLAAVNYISSAGLRVLLAAEKESKKRGGKFIITGVIPEVQDVFDMTGFSDILTIE